MERYRSILDDFTRLARHPRRAQQQTLSRFLTWARDSLYGRHHGYEPDLTIEQFQQRVPIITYEDVRPWLERDPASLTGDTPDVLCQTSGFSGERKLIPSGPEMRRGLASGLQIYTAALFLDHPHLPLKPGLPPRAVGLYHLDSAGETALGVPVSSSLNEVFASALPEDPFFFGFDEAVYRIDAMADRLFAMALIAARRETRALRATNPTTLLAFARLLAENTDAIISDLALGRCRSRPHLAPVVDPLIRPDAALADRLRSLRRALKPRDLLPSLDLLITWQGGACGRFRPYLLEAFDGAAIRPLLFGTSEGQVAVPTDDTMRGGVPLLSVGFFEFLPVDGGAPLLIDELQAGARYELLMTSFSGLCRYRVGDVVEVEGAYEACPTITFVGRAGATSSFTGEKLTEVQVEDAVAACERRLGVRIKHYCVSARFAERPNYVLSVEWDDSARGDTTRLATEVDRALAERNIEYGAKQRSGRLGPLEPNEVVHGAFEKLFSERSTSSSGTVKLPRLTGSALHERLESYAAG